MSKREKLIREMVALLVDPTVSVDSVSRTLRLLGVDDAVSIAHEAAKRAGRA